ncbi:GNAT family N-acetyltransferase [Cytophagia bacterium CHB2]|nr:GNAT family N-acetyltransferase [Cytophagia bacterium CHB2]
MIHIERIDTLAEFASLREEWNDLLAASGSESIHLRHEWLYTWAVHFLAKKDLLVLRLCEGNDTIGFAPLQVRTIRLRGMLPYRQVLFLGDPESDFSDFIVARHREQALRAIFARLRSRLTWGEMLFHNISDTSPNLYALKDILVRESAIVREQTKCYYIDTQAVTWEQYYATTSKSFVQQDLRRLHNHLRDKNWEVVESPLTDIHREIETIYFLHHCSQTRKARSSYYASDRYRRFIAAMMEELKRFGEIRLFYLLLDKKPIAFVLGFHFRKIFYYWNIGFDSAHQKLSPSKVLLAEVIQRCFHSGVNEFNFMRGDSDYKTRWTKQFRSNFQIRWLNERGFYGFFNQYRSHSGQTSRAEQPQLEPA